MAWLRRVGLAAFCVGVVAAGYLCWCQHRLRGTTIVSDSPDWPRGWPYPDGWLMRWEQHLDAAHPAPAGQLKMHGELDRLRGRVAASIVIAGAVAYFGLCGVIWPQALSRRTR